MGWEKSLRTAHSHFFSLSVLATPSGGKPASSPVYHKDFFFLSEALGPTLPEFILQTLYDMFNNLAFRTEVLGIGRGGAFRSCFEIC